MEINGVSYQLITSDNINYHTNPDQHFKITRSGNTWNVYDTSGNFYRFGGTTDSQQYLSGNVYYCWDLSQMQDTNGNTANISYLQDVEGSSPNIWVRSAYPASMTYGSMQVIFNSSYDQHSSTDGYLRNDDPVSYGSNPAPEVMDNAKLNSIAIKVSGTLIRQYNFTYNTTNSTYSSDYGGIYYAGTFTLASLTQIGSDGTSQMPSMSFSYQSLQTYYQDTTSQSYSGNPGNPASFTWPHLTVVNNGYGGSTTFAYTEIPNSSTTNIWTREAVTQKTVSPGIGPNQTTQYAYSGSPAYFGTGWTEQFRGWNQVTETDAAGNYIIHWFYTTGTINGNDAEKLTGNEYQTQWYNSSGTLLNTKTYSWNWTQTGQYSGPPYQAVTPSSVTSWNVTSPAGIAVSPTGNVYVCSTANNVVTEYTSSGASVTSWAVNSPTGIAVSPTGNVYVCSTSNNLVTEWTSSGGSVASWTVTSPTAIAVSPIGIVYVCSAAGNVATEWTSNGGSVTSWAVTSPTGIAVSPNGNVYVCSTGGNVVTEWTSTGSSVTSWTVTSPTSITVLSTCNVFVCSTGGNVVTEWTGTGTSVTSWAVTSPNGVAASSTGDIYSCSNAGTSVGEYLVATPTVYPAYSVYMSQVDNTVGNKTSQTRYSYDSYGNIITEYDDGDISTTADDSTIWTVYNANITSNILDKPARVRTYATAMSTDSGGSNLKQETDYYYDGQSNSTPPAKGNLTSEVQSINASNSITTSYTYDSYGNKLTETDGNGNKTTWTYDSTYHTYMAIMTDPITSLTESYTYDPGTNNILTTTNVNGQVTTNYYDVFKRLISVVKPGDSQSSPSITYQYNSWGTQNSQNVETFTKIDSTHSIWSADYFDGLGRVVQSQAESATTGHTTISSTTVYNNCGEVAQQYVSQDIASNLSAYYTTGISGWKYTGYTYDGMGRVLTQTNPDGTVTTNNYSTPWQTTTTDANGVSTVDVYDAFSRLIQVQNLPGATVVTNSASNVGNTTATLNGTLTVLGNASSATVSFQYGTTTAYGSTMAGTPSTLSAAGAFSANLTGLTVGTTYHFRTEAVAGTTTVYGADQSFVTTGGSTPPTVSSVAATNVSSTWATLNGNVSNLGSAASDTVSFDYGTTTSYGSNITAVPSPMTAAGSFNINLTGLTPGTVYHYRAKATGNGTTNGSDQQFTTSTGTPVVITQSVATGADDGFAGSGTFDNSDTWYEIGQPYSAWFRFTGITIPTGATIIAAHLIIIEGQWDSGTSLTISADDSQSPTAPTSQLNLASKTRTSTNVSWTSGYSDYQWHNSPDFTTVIQQLVNSFTYSNGSIQILVDNNNSSSGAELAGSTFEDGYAPQLYIQYQTSGGSSTTPPSVSTSAASSVGSSTVTLNGSLTGLGSAASATVSFEYGTTTNYGNTATGSPSSLSSTGTFTANLTGLAPSTAYHYCSEAVGAATTFGPDQQFTTTSSGSSTVAFTQSVTTAADNGFAGSGIFDNSDTWYEVGQPYSAWFRFTGITIPAGATILAAHLTLIEGQWDSGTSLTISADDSQSPVAPTSQSDLASKTRTSTGVAWTSGSSDYQWHNSPDFTSVIQQLVNSFTYSNGAIQILVDNNNSSSGAELVGSTFENTGYAPELYIQYQTSGGTASAIVTNYTYDVLGNMTSATDNNGNSTYMTYDWLSRKTGMTDPDMGSWSYTYDADGNLVSQTDAKNQTITMVYDAMDRLTNKNYPSGLGMTNIVYSYDSITNGNYGKGLQTGMTDASGTTSDIYDTRGRLVQETKTINSTPYTTSYTYDGLDRVATITYPTGETVTNSYNTGGMPSTISSSAVGNLVTNTTYNQLDDISEIDLNNGVKTTYGYYGTGGTNDTTGGYYGQLWQIKSASQSTTLQDIQYTWDADGNLTQQENLVSGQTENFTYDSLDRLTTASGAYSQTYTYDALGNITSMTNNGNTQFYSYGAKPDAVTQVGSTSYAYDANGNMTSRGAQTISWNVDNQPATISGGTSFVYDGDGNRVEETTGGQTTVYINQYYQKNITTGVATTYYYLGSQLVAQNTGSTLRYVSQDNLGSTATMSTSTGTLDSSISYYPFGGVESGSVNTVKDFTGQILDSMGLYYYNARYYDPTIGRFISGDSLVSKPFNPQDLNRYSYCLNNPMKYTDPTGHDEIIAVGGVNSDGDTWYTISDGQGNLLAIATGMDQLAQEMAACQAESQNIYLPLGQGAENFLAATGEPSAAELTNGIQSTPTPTTSSSSSTPTTTASGSTVSVKKDLLNNVAATIGTVGVVAGVGEMYSGFGLIVAAGTAALSGVGLPEAGVMGALGICGVIEGYGITTLGNDIFYLGTGHKLPLPELPDWGPISPFDGWYNYNW